MDQPSKIRIGTCAWSYDDWRGAFYPEHLPAHRRLEFYAQHFDAVEVDSTFYHPPTAQATAHWLEVTPPDFVFTCKLPREITHERKLRDCTEPLDAFLHALEPLRPKLGCVLVQLPPFFSLKKDEGALREFVHALPTDWRFAIEFRRPEWHLPRIVQLLKEHHVGWVWNDLTSLEHQQEGAFEFLPETTDFTYVRLMGDLEKKYRPDGTRLHTYRELQWPRDTSLENWAARLRQSLPRMERAFVLVSNHFEGFAPQTCARLAERCGLPFRPLPETPEQQLDLL